MRRIRKGRGDDAPILMTAFSPLTIARKLAGERLREDMTSAPDAVQAALEAGADGIFFATQAATPEVLTAEEHARWDLPYAIVEQVRDAVRQAEGVGVIVGPGCVLPLDVPNAHLAAVVDTASFR